MAPSLKFEQNVSEEFDQNVIHSKSSPSISVQDVLRTKIDLIDHNVCEPGDEDAFFVADFKELEKALALWKQRLPQIHPHYAVKCNNDVEVVKYLASQGVNFDCASKSEIEFILNLGVSPDRIVYANPCKTNSYIRYAKKNLVNLTTVDNADELYKLSEFHPTCGVLIRIATDDSTAQCQLSTKFGCTVDTALNGLLPLAKRLGINVRGVAFHVGSGAKDVDPIMMAIRESRVIFDRAIELEFDQVNILDIGGGFEQETFDASSSMVNYALDKYFPSDFVKSQEINFIAEPGRFMVANVFTLATHVIAKRQLPVNENGIESMLYINDGVYGNLNCILFDHQHPNPYLLESTLKSGGIEAPLNSNTDEKGKCYFYSIWGPTCDGLDCVSTKSHFQNKVQVGDWIYFPKIGAYTSVASTSFNGFGNKNEVIYINCP